VIVLLLISGQTIIFLLRLVAADRRSRRRPLGSATKTVGELEDAAEGSPELAENVSPEALDGSPEDAAEAPPEDAAGPAGSTSDTWAVPPPSDEGAVRQ
jgi:hypothetical protein